MIDTGPDTATTISLANATGAVAARPGGLDVYLSVAGVVKVFDGVTDS